MSQLNDKNLRLRNWILKSPHHWVMTAPDEVRPQKVPKNPPPTLRHYLIEKCRAEREGIEDWDEVKEEEEDEQQDEVYPDDPLEEENEMVEYMEPLPEAEVGDDDDSQFDWYEPRGGGEAPVRAPILVPVRQKGPAKFIPLNMGKDKGKGKGKGKKGKGKGKNQGGNKGYHVPFRPFMPRPPMGHATPLNNPAIVPNPLRYQQQ